MNDSVRSSAFRRRFSERHALKAELRTIFASVALNLIACSGAFAQPPEIYFPPNDGEWETVEPSDARFDAARLDAAAEYAKSEHSSALIVLHFGRILLERHWKIEPDSEHSSPGYQMMVQGYTEAGHVIEDVASIQKSVTAYLAGPAVASGKLYLDEPVDGYLGFEWSNADADEEEAITVRHLMSMTSGLSETLYFEQPAGTAWAYNTGAYRPLVDVLEVAYGKPIDAITREFLTGPLGMHDSRWISRADNPKNRGFATTARDLARFGLLIMARGNWAGKNLGCSAEYFDKMLSSSSELNPTYGLLWWLNGSVEYRGRTGSPLPTAPPDMVVSIGALGRKLYVSRSTGLVVVRLGNRTAPEFDNELWRLLKEAQVR